MKRYHGLGGLGFVVLSFPFLYWIFVFDDVWKLRVPFEIGAEGYHSVGFFVCVLYVPFILVPVLGAGYARCTPVMGPD